MPRHIRSDNGPEFIAACLRSSLSAANVGPLYIEPGSPWEYGYAGSFHSKLRDEFLECEVFETVHDAQAMGTAWRRSYNVERPHMSLGYRTPEEFARTCVASIPAIHVLISTDTLTTTGTTNEGRPAALKACRQRMVDNGTMCRGFINKSVGRIRRIFRYGVENELIPAAILTGLEAVPPLLAGRTEAKDYPPRSAVPLDHIEIVKKNVSQQTADMIDLALLKGSWPATGTQLEGASEKQGTLAINQKPRLRRLLDVLNCEMTYWK